MSPLQKIAIGMVIVVGYASFPAKPSPTWERYDVLADPVGWLLVLSGTFALARVEDTFATSRWLAGLAGAVSVPTWLPQLSHQLDASGAWFASLPQIAFCLVLAREIGMLGARQAPPDGYVAKRFGLLVTGFAVVGALTEADEIRPESRTAIDDLHARGVRVAMITGDARQVADAVAAELGIDEVFAEVLPQDKDGKVAELQGRHQAVAMVGDGVNDAPALARADVGIAIGAGTDVAIESAGVVLASSDPRSVTGVIDLSRASYRKMIQNLVWATAYNLIAIPVAAGVFEFAGITMPPAAAAVAMSLSTIIVAANAQLLRRLDLRPLDLRPLALRPGDPTPSDGANRPVATGVL